MGETVSNINVDTGKRRFTINGDPDKVIEFNVTDGNLITRISEAEQKISKAVKGMNIELKPDGTPAEDTPEIAEKVKKIDGLLRGALDYAFDGKICDTVFGNTNLLSVKGGVTFAERFIDAVTPIIEREVKEENARAMRRIEKHTAKYAPKKAGKK